MMMDGEPGIVIKKECTDDYTPANPGYYNPVNEVFEDHHLNCSQVTSLHKYHTCATHTDSSSATPMNISVQWTEDPPTDSSANENPEDPLCGPIVKVEPTCDTINEDSKQTTNLLALNSEDISKIKEECSEEVVDPEHKMATEISHFADDNACSSTSVVKDESKSPSSASGERLPEVLACDLPEVCSDRADADVNDCNYGAFVCSCCKSRFNSASALGAHRRQTHDTSLWTCSTCGSKFIRLQTFRKHIEKIHPEGESLVCGTCDAKFSRRDLLSEHRKIHKSYICGICRSGFNSPYLLKKHLRRSHSGVEFSCVVCDAKFTSQDNLKKHAKVHTGNKPYSCDVCGSKFSQPNLLKRHNRTHTGEKPYVCDICGSEFSESGHLRTHQKIHTGEKPYACEFCNSRFARKSLLQIHVRVHTGEKPYSCPECDAEFAQKVHLTSHLRIHTKAKPYPCEVCDSRFRFLGPLKNHMKMHNGETPHACTLCEAKFTRETNLKNHMKTHSSEKLFACEICGARFGLADTLRRHRPECAKRSKEAKLLLFS